jgi:hypothetical protein
MVQLYALAAFLAAGLTGGLVYWAAAGRYVPRAAAAPPPAKPPAPSGPSPVSHV